jgi:hypothetical protein
MSEGIRWIGSLDSQCVITEKCRKLKRTRNNVTIMIDLNLHQEARGGSGGPPGGPPGGSPGGGPGGGGRDSSSEDEDEDGGSRTPTDMEDEVEGVYPAFIDPNPPPKKNRSRNCDQGNTPHGSTPDTVQLRPYIHPYQRSHTVELDSY